MFLSFLISAANSKQWAVLMAGSKGYQNYRHQADVFNIYNILTRRGFPKENIITLAYNDVVNHKLNPYPGKVFATKDHKDVYPGRENIDYVGKDANAENFIRVLLGDSHNGRALETTEEDDIFIYYDDHGAPGVLCVPTYNGPEIYADQISAAIDQMKKDKKFRRILFVIEACYSGSVATNISGSGVYVVSAAGPQQSSFSAQWDQELRTFRTNEFTQYFLQSAQEKPDGKILDVVNEASKKTIHSHVQAFGDFKVSQLPLSTFMLTEAPLTVDNSEDYELEENSLYENGASNSDAFVAFLQRRLNQADTPEEKKVLQQALDNEIQRRKQSTSIFNNIERKMVPNGIPAGTPFVRSIKYDCYRAAIEAFRLFCGEIDEHELAKVQIFTHLCEKFSTKEIVQQIRQTCPALQWTEDELYF